MTRLTWDAVWMAHADNIGRRSRCNRADIGCVLVSPDNRTSTAGYVGPPADYAPAADDTTTCIDWCPRAQPGHTLQPGYEDCCSCHAEMNAAANATLIGGGVFVGGTAYVNAVVCFTCVKVLAAQRLARVVMRGGDPHRNPSKTITYLEAAGLQVDIYEEASDD